MSFEGTLESPSIGRSLPRSHRLSRSKRPSAPVRRRRARGGSEDEEAYQGEGHDQEGGDEETGHDQDRAEEVEEMRTLTEANDQLEKYSGQASERARWLAAAGLAFVWLLAGGQLVSLRRELLAVALLLVLTLLADFAQYVAGWARWESLVRRTESECESPSKETPVSVQPTSLVWIYVPFYAKLILITLAYLTLGIVIAARLAVPSPACI
jgi:hypothetical protein